MILHLFSLTISIHALREEGDDIHEQIPGGNTGISIHALREEGDQRCDTIYRADDDFYPRPPRGGRPSYPPDREQVS